MKFTVKTSELKKWLDIVNHATASITTKTTFWAQVEKYINRNKNEKTYFITPGS